MQRLKSTNFTLYKLYFYFSVRSQDLNKFQI